MSRKRLIAFGVLLITGGIACWFVPLFHIRPLDGRASEAGERMATPRASSPSDPAAYVNDFWDRPLRKGEGGIDISRFWQAFDEDSSMAKRQYGRQAGIGGAWYFCVRGRGTVEKIERNRCTLTVDDSPHRVCLELGVVVDNTVREAVGVKASDFANSQEFNAISSELNRRVEQDVIAPNMRLLNPGVVVEFVGCAKVGGDSDLDPLCLVPIWLEVHQRENGDENSVDTAIEATSP